MRMNCLDTVIEVQILINFHKFEFFNSGKEVIILSPPF